MLDKRSKGLIAIHGVIVMIVLPLVFVTTMVVGVELSDRFDYSLINFPLYLGATLFSGLIFFQFYQPLVSFSRQSRWPLALKVTNLQTLVLLLVFFGLMFAIKDRGISRILMGSFVVAGFAVLLLLNLGLPSLLSRVALSGKNLRTCLVVGSVERCRQLAPWLRTSTELGVDLVGLLTPEGESGVGAEADLPLPVIGSSRDLAPMIASEGANQVILLETRQSKAWVSEILKTCEEGGCQVLIYNPWTEFFDQPLVGTRFGQHTVFTLREEPLESPANRLMKRLLDLLVSLPVVVLLLPLLMLLVWIRQRKESPGPLFYVQKRKGLGRQEFRLFKFRTMHVNRPVGDEVLQASADDPRVFPYGRFLRRSSLDEIPQFVNVLLGQMSVVGPRPHLPEHDILFARDVKIYPQRQFAKPGLTGLAQVNGYRGEITDIELLRKRVMFDLEYINEWSLWLDLAIILRTIRVVLQPPKTAY